MLYHTKLSRFGRIKLHKTLSSFMNLKKGEILNCYCENNRIILEKQSALCERCGNFEETQLYFEKGHIYCTVCEKFLQSDFKDDINNNIIKFH